MPDEPDITSTPCDTPSVEQAQITLVERIQRCGSWSDECDQAAEVYVRAMVRAGLAEEAISKELRNLGLSVKGTIELIHQVQTAENLSGTDGDFYKPVTDRSGLRLLLGIVLVTLLLLLAAITMDIAQSGEYIVVFPCSLVAGVIVCIYAYIRSKILDG